ncbi:MAG TPA: phosphoglucomutase/phosphomannomutase family protein, partial [Methylomirabilota bacterium]|nr:phosphoglucomutase/phosphomannomutase family protein [Methylomirabilota bacterium]
LGELITALHAEFGEHHYGRVDLDVTPVQKERAIGYFSDEKLKKLGDWRITRREDMDGIKIYLDGFGWALVRASGTENLLRLYSETNDPGTTRRVLQVVAETVQKL